MNCQSNARTDRPPSRSWQTRRLVRSTSRQWARLGGRTSSNAGSMRATNWFLVSAGCEDREAAGCCQGETRECHFASHTMHPKLAARRSKRGPTARSGRTRAGRRPRRGTRARLGAAFEFNKNSKIELENRPGAFVVLRCANYAGRVDVFMQSGISSITIAAPPRRGVVRGVRPRRTAHADLRRLRWHAVMRQGGRIVHAYRLDARCTVAGIQCAECFPSVTGDGRARCHGACRVWDGGGCIHVEECREEIPLARRRRCCASSWQPRACAGIGAVMERHAECFWIGLQGDAIVGARRSACEVASIPCRTNHDPRVFSHLWHCR
jgi:hypothetical protein